MTMSDPYPQPHLPRALIILAALALTLAVVAMAVLETPVGRIVTVPHAEKHAEAAQIRECLVKYGPSSTWSTDDPSISIFCVELRDNYCGIMVAQRWRSLVDGADYRERTSFCPRGGRVDRVMKYLEKVAKRVTG
jgi:hypothetical protein